jgi:hypothetical protein
MKKLITALALFVIVAVGIWMLAGKSLSASKSQISYHAPFQLKGDPDALESAQESSNQRTEVGERGVADEGRLSAAEEEYAIRAYPAEQIPFELTLNAQAAYQQVQSRGVGKGKNVPGNWVAIGPSSAKYPGILTFSGQEYITSGRTTALEISPTCSTSKCRVWLGAAGGGVWRTDNALSGNPKWTFVSGGLPSNAIGSLALDPNDPSGNTIYAGTGEANASADSEAGVGLYKSTDGGDSWSLVGTSMDVSYGRSIGSIAIHPTNPNIIYFATTRGVRGVSSVSSGGATSNPPVAAPFGLYMSSDGGTTWNFIWDGNGSVRGVRRVMLDPLNPDRVYASAYQNGIWRSTSGGTFEQVFAPTAPSFNTDRTEFALTVADGHTRIYAGDGAQGAPPASFWRVDNADVPANTLTDGTSNIGWKLLTSSDPTNPYFATYNYCTGQCWYDQYVYTPAGFPDVVYLGGSFQYGEYGGISNARAVVMSSDAGENFTDMTWDSSSSTPTGMHPDQHALVTVPGDPYLFFAASDGGLMRSSGKFKDNSAECNRRGLDANSLAACMRLLSRVPSNLFSLNTGLSTLQFQSLSVSPSNSKNLMGGTQDNGTFETTGSYVVWPQIIYGDGGQSGFSSADSALRFNTFTGQATDVNFRNGQPTKWVIATGPIISSPEGSYFYPPVIADPNPANGGTIFQGSNSVWRTQDWGGDRDYLEANCPEFTTSAANPNCGDFVRIGPSGNTSLTTAFYGNRAGGFVAAIERAPSDTSTLWVATGTGRVFVSQNSDAAAEDVTFARIDNLAANAPGRFVTSIYVDPANPNHAWISYSGYNFNTPAQPGHVFEVTYDPSANSATWTNLDGGTGPMGDLPVTDLVRDDVTGDLYAGTDFGVLRLEAGSSTWTVAGTGLPGVETAGLTIMPGDRVLYAATHGRSAWKLTLP